MYSAFIGVSEQSKSNMSSTLALAILHKLKTNVNDERWMTDSSCHNSYLESKTFRAFRLDDVELFGVGKFKGYCILYIHRLYSALYKVGV